MSAVHDEGQIRDALRYMRAAGSEDPGLISMVESAFARLETVIRPRSIWARFSVAVDGVRVEVAGIKADSSSLARLMERSEECCMMAVTLGHEADREISLAQRRGDIAEALALDACASARVDRLCDEVETEIFRSLSCGENLTKRFSPGYGDVSLGLTVDIIEALNATRRIGLSVTRSMMMTPVKSITAIVGIVRGQKKEQAEPERCSSCPDSENCPYSGLRQDDGRPAGFVTGFSFRS